MNHLNIALDNANKLCTDDRIWEWHIYNQRIDALSLRSFTTDSAGSIVHLVFRSPKFLDIPGAFKYARFSECKGSRRSAKICYRFRKNQEYLVIRIDYLLCDNKHELIKKWTAHPGFIVCRSVEFYNERT